MAKGGRGVGGGVNSDSDEDRFAGAPATLYTVMIHPQRDNVLHFGPHTLEIPARAICAPNAGYGLEMFDRDCKSRKTPVVITAMVRATADGIPRIDLMPEMRFSPTQVVTLTLRVPTLKHAEKWRILYCPTQSMAHCVDEAIRDPSLATHVDYRASTLFRRIKHFSGYFVES